ncbi:hypothetical protein F5Y06DRAFT_266618 [Hypoxylon sp. FL0890]|nr:hypothetical protein F5Y06DRAFT_266618 [Hypoxylon sp. FL0890]
MTLGKSRISYRIFGVRSSFLSFSFFTFYFLRTVSSLLRGFTCMRPWVKGGVRLVGTVFPPPESKGQRIHDAMIPKQPTIHRGEMDAWGGDNGGGPSLFLALKINFS